MRKQEGREEGVSKKEIEKNKYAIYAYTHGPVTGSGLVLLV